MRRFIFSNKNLLLANTCLLYTSNKQILFDPGLPESRQFICRVVRDIVSRYDVDAIHMDDYFYPYPVAGMPFPDDKSFQKYGLNKGYKASQRADWRRENVNKLVREIKRTILLSKPCLLYTSLCPGDDGKRVPVGTG